MDVDCAIVCDGDYDDPGNDLSAFIIGGAKRAVLFTEESHIHPVMPWIAPCNSNCLTNSDIIFGIMPGQTAVAAIILKQLNDTFGIEYASCSHVQSTYNRLIGTYDHSAGGMAGYLPMIDGKKDPSSLYLATRPIQASKKIGLVVPELNGSI